MVQGKGPPPGRGPPKPPPHGPFAARRSRPRVAAKMAEEREYGVAASFDFPLVVFGSTDADFSTAAPAFVAGDVRLSKDGSTWANATNTTGVAQIGINSGVYTISLTATEMQMARGVLAIIDQSSTKIWEDQAISITTYGSTAALHRFNRNSSSPGVTVQAMDAGVIGSTQLAANTITSTKIASAALTAAKFAADALSTANIADGVFTQIWAESTRTLTSLPAGIISSGVISSGMVANIVDDVWDEILTGATHNVAASAGRRLRLLTGVVSVDGTVNSTAATPTSIPTNTTQGIDHWNDALMVFLTGNLTGQARAVKDYSTAGVVTIDDVDAFTLAPANGDEFVFVSDHIHPITQIADGVWDELRAGHTTAGTFGEGVLLATGAIGSTQIASAAITEAKFAADALSTANIADGVFTQIWNESTRTLTSLGVGLITSTSIAAGAITEAKFATGALTSGVIAQGVFDKIADSVWDEAKAGHVGAGSFGEEVQSHALSAEISALNDLSAAEVNAEVLDVLSVDTFGEPVTTTSAPIVTETLARKLGVVYSALINRLDVTSAAKSFYTSTGGISWSKALSDDGVTYSEAQGSS